MWPRPRGADPMMRAIQDLTAGHKSALLLRQRLFGDYSDSCDDGEVRRLVEKIILSFHDSITALDSFCGDRRQAEETSSSAKADVEDSGESCKPRSHLAVVRKGRRGCYKRRKGSSESWTNVVPALMDDGQTWRKYGQKVILNAPFPRSYFRCTHKKDQGCPATKQVQQTQSDPPQYTINYDGRHTCTNSLKSPSPFVASSTAMLSFNSAKSDLYQGCCSLVPSEYYDMELLEFASNASSELSNLEFLQGGVDMFASDLDDYMKLEFE